MRPLTVKGDECALDKQLVAKGDEAVPDEAAHGKRWQGYVR